MVTNVKLKYYMRGLGIGIVVTSLLMGYSNHSSANEKNNSTQVSEVVAEQESASSLTLREHDESVQQNTEPAVDDTTEETTPVAEDEALIANSSTDKNGINEDVQNSLQETATEEAEDSTIEEQIKDADVATLKNGDKVIITVNTGEGSGTVARKLETAGVIDNASEFDAYLMQHGYDKSITRGDHEVIVGSSWMDIAQQMTKTKQ